MEMEKNYNSTPIVLARGAVNQPIHSLLDDDIETIVEEPTIEVEDIETEIEEELEENVNSTKTVYNFLKNYNIDSKDVKKGLITALQIELNKLGAELEVNGIFNGNTKTAYATYAGIVSLGTENVFTLIWKYLLIEKGYTFENIDMNFDEDCFEKTKNFQNLIKTAASGIVGFNLLSAALR